MKAIIFFLFVLLVLPLVFANAAPGFNFGSGRPSQAIPYPPDVTVHMQVNGSPDIRITKITYHCEGSNNTATGAVTQRMIDLPCSNGKCSNTNNEWFYRFNPCFDFHSGFFSYGLDGKELRTKSVNFPERGKSYDITIESESGTVKSAKKSNNEYLCASAFLIPFIIFAAFASVRK